MIVNKMTVHERLQEIVVYEMNWKKCRRNDCGQNVCRHNAMPPMLLCPKNETATVQRMLKYFRTRFQL